MKTVKVPITDVLDLHTFRPEDVPDLLKEYLRCCIDEGIFSVRIIHGKGQGMLKKRVIITLEGMPVVVSFKDASLEAGGWGATIVELKRGLNTRS